MLRKVLGAPVYAQILTALVLGAVAGFIAQQVYGHDSPALKSFVDTVAIPLGNVFLYLLFMMVVPLLFSALVLGVSELGEAAKIGKIGVYSLGMTLLLSGIAVVIAMVGVNLAKPGHVVSPEVRERLMQSYGSKDVAARNLEAAQKAPDDPPALGIVPRNPFKEVNRALEGGLLPFMFFALVFGLALSSIDPERAAPVKALMDGVFLASQKVIEWAMRYGPIGVFFLVFRTTATLGEELFMALGAYVALVLALLAIHMFGVYSLVLKWVARMSPRDFFSRTATVMLTAFATSSSNATLPTALKSAREDLKLPQDISSFVLTVGATANQNGTALFEGVTIVFLAQLFGVELSMAQQLTIMGLAIVAGIGTAGIPGGAWPMIATILVMFRIPAEAIGIVIGIDRILDMSRTVLNVSGDMTIAACVSRLAGHRPDAQGAAA